MWWPWFLSLFLLGSTFAEEAKKAEDFFTLLGGTGTCDDTTMNAFLVDAIALANAFNSAVMAISNNPAEKEGYVARFLLSTWLGISIDDGLYWITKTDIEGKEWNDYTAQWERVLDVNDQVKDFLDGNGLIAPESSPELLCGGTSFRAFEWKDSVLEWDSSKGTETAREIDDSEVMISQVYDYDSESLPYLLQNNHKYYVVRDDLSPTNICNPLDTSKEPFLAHVFSGQAATRKTVMAQPVFIDGVSPLVVMCPAGLEKGSLSDLESKKGTRIIGETNINEINQEVPGPTTLFHELIHLTSFWAETDDGAFTKSDNYIKDYSYDAVECLQMASTGIEVTISDETKVYTPGDASLNAESYTFFALSYWYFMETDQTFYEGLLVNWDNETPEPEAVAKRSSVDGARPYRRWLGHSHDETRHY